MYWRLCVPECEIVDDAVSDLAMKIELFGCASRWLGKNRTMDDTMHGVFLPRNGELSIFRHTCLMWTTLNSLQLAEFVGWLT